MNKVDSRVSRGDDSFEAIAQQVILREANAIDTQQWNEWLSLYVEDAVFWLPAWLDEHRITSNIDQEMSHIYHDSRLEMSERVMRITSNKSASALPLPRTMHLIGPPLITKSDGSEITARSNAIVHIYDPRSMKHHVTASRYEHQLRRNDEGAWLIKSKKIILINDCMPSVIDFYSI